MSHQTGIQANDELKLFLGKCKSGAVRIFKVEIVDEQLTLGDVKEASGNWEHDYDSIATRMMKDQQPCYLFFRFDTKNDAGYEWLMISWSPDNSPVRQKMLYASTKATLKKEFGAGQIKEEIFGTIKTDISLKALQKQLKGTSPGPMTRAEEELLNIKKLEINSIGDYSQKQQSLQSLAFPVSKEALVALTEFKKKKITYVQLSIDIPKEQINLAKTANLDVSSLSSQMPLDHARYHIFFYPHSNEGDYVESVVFIYSAPANNCSVRERMLYSSCKSPLIEVISKQVELHVDKKLEVDCPEEMSEKALLDELHPKKILHQPQFSKPKGPTNRGARRLTKHAS